MSETTPSAPAPDLRKAAILRAVQWLIGAGTKFAVIEADGTRHGTLEVVEKRGITRARKRFPSGQVTEYLLPFIKDAKVGDIKLIPWGPYGADEDARRTLHKTVSAKCFSLWGKGKYMTGASEKGVEAYWSTDKDNPLAASSPAP